jgi:preprotein translocase subunit SecG
MSNGWIFDNGIIAGCILWVKFSFLGFWFGWILAILTCLLFKKQFQSILRSIIYFCLGMVISTLPWLIYFGINHSINDWISSYLLINITNYPVQMPLFGRIRFIFSAISGQVGVNPLFGMILWLGLLYLYLSKKIFTSALQRVLIVLLVLFFIIGIYGGGLRYLYYYLILAPLSIFGFIAFDQFIFEHPGFEMSLKTSLATFFVLLFLLSVYLANFQDNVYMLSWKKNDLVQYKFAELIEQSETPTLLEYGTLDLGFYTTTGIIPNCRFFIRQNLRQSSALPILEEQNRYIKDKLVEYIVTRQPVVNSEDQLEIPNLYENYYLLSTQDQLSEKVIYRYYLFKRID